MSTPLPQRSHESTYLPTWASLGTDTYGMLPLHYPSASSLPLPSTAPPPVSGQTTSNTTNENDSVEITLASARKLESYIEKVLKDRHADNDEAAQIITQIFSTYNEFKILCEEVAGLDEKYRQSHQSRSMTQANVPYQSQPWTNNDAQQLEDRLTRLGEMCSKLDEMVRHLNLISNSTSSAKTSNSQSSNNQPNQEGIEDQYIPAVPTFTGALWKKTPADSDTRGNEKSAQDDDESDEIVKVDDRKSQRRASKRNSDDDSDLTINSVNSSSSSESTDEDTRTEGDVYLGMHPESCMSDATIKLKDSFETYWKTYQAEVDDSPAQVMAWNALAGAVAYLTSFGIANSIARPIPFCGSVLVPFLAAPLHTFVSGPLSGMIRAKTWTNPRLNEWLYHQRIKGRLAGDVHRTKTELQLKEKFPVKADDGSHTYVTAEKFLEKNGISPDARSQLRQTEDWPFTAFTGSYIARNSLLEIDRGLANPHAYWPSETSLAPEPMPSPAPAPDSASAPQPAPSPAIGGSPFITNKTVAGWASDFTLQHVFGSLAGALTMMLSQHRREQLAPETGGEAKITKPIHAWKLENAFYESYKRDLESRLQTTADGPYKKQLSDELQRVEKNLSITSQKTDPLKLYIYEVGLILQEKRTAVAGDPEQPGKRIEAVADCFGKWVSLLPFAVVAPIVQNFCSGTASSKAGAVGLVAARVIAAPAALIIMPGWMSRLDYAAWLRRTVGEHKGRRSALIYANNLQAKENEVGFSPSSASNRDVTTEVGGIASVTRNRVDRADTSSEMIISFDGDSDEDSDAS